MTLKSSTQLLHLVLRTQVQVSWVSVRPLAPAAASCLLEDTDAFEIVKAQKKNNNNKKKRLLRLLHLFPPVGAAAPVKPKEGAAAGLPG